MLSDFKSIIRRIVGKDVREIGGEVCASEVRVTTKFFDYLLAARPDNGQPVEDLELRFLRRCLSQTSESCSQLFQDLFVLTVLEDKRQGYFVEFGATDGVSLSNTFLLEKKYGWNGALAEPAKSWHESLRRNRTVQIFTKCVWSRSNQTVAFWETDWREGSTIEAFVNDDMHAKTREQGHRYSVDTVTLNDLLVESGAPSVIDYLSIDTEGSEIDILAAHDFDKHGFRIITVEHNFTHKRKLIFDLLSSKGYERVLEHFSKFDDWYVKRT